MAGQKKWLSDIAADSVSGTTPIDRQHCGQLARRLDLAGAMAPALALLKQQGIEIREELQQSKQSLARATAAD